MKKVFSSSLLLLGLFSAALNAYPPIPNPTKIPPAKAAYPPIPNPTKIPPMIKNSLV